MQLSPRKRPILADVLSTARPADWDALQAIRVKQPSHRRPQRPQHLAVRLRHRTREGRLVRRTDRRDICRASRCRHWANGSPLQPATARLVDRVRVEEPPQRLSVRRQRRLAILGRRAHLVEHPPRPRQILITHRAVQHRLQRVARRPETVLQHLPQQAERLDVEFGRSAGAGEDERGERAGVQAHAVLVHVPPQIERPLWCVTACGRLDDDVVRFGAGDRVRGETHVREEIERCAGLTVVEERAHDESVGRR